MLPRLFFPIGLFLAAACFATLPAVEIVAHRGSSFEAPENTLAAMKLAWEQGADAVELDLWLSKDQRLVVMHDETTKRIGGVDKKIAEQTWEELQALDVGGWKSAKYAGERIPTLESILTSTPAGRKVVLEIKGGTEVVPVLHRVIQESGVKPGQLMIISFKYEVLQASKPLLPAVEHYLLSGYKKDKKTGELPTLAGLVEKAKAAGLDGLDLHYDWPIDAAFVKGLKAEGLKLLTWTVNDVARAVSQVEAGVDGITTDKPAELKAALRK